MIKNDKTSAKRRQQKPSEIMKKYEVRKVQEAQTLRWLFCSGKAFREDVIPLDILEHKKLC
jgi:hypothetical protein